MGIVNKTTLKSYFETGDSPTQANFEDLIDSLAVLDESNSGDLTVNALTVLTTWEDFVGADSDKQYIPSFKDGAKEALHEMIESNVSASELDGSSVSLDDLSAYEYLYGAWIIEREGEPGQFSSFDIGGVSYSVFCIATDTWKLHIDKADYVFEKEIDDSSSIVPLDTFPVTAGIVPNTNQTLAFTLQTIGKITADVSSSYSVGDFLAQKFDIVVTDTSGTVTYQVDAHTQVTNNSALATNNVEITFDISSGTFRVKGQGVSGATILWKAKTSNIIRL